jgi:hypothetical protein
MAMLLCRVGFVGDRTQHSIRMVVTMVPMRVTVAHMVTVRMVVAAVSVCDGGGFSVVVAHR